MDVAGHTLPLPAALEHAGLCVAIGLVWGVIVSIFMCDHSYLTINVSELNYL